MSLNDENKEIDFFENWPKHYYNMTDPVKRKAILLASIDKNLDSNKDSLRLKIYNKRYEFNSKKNSYADTFMRAWLLIKASEAVGISKFQKKHKQKELETLMDTLGVLNYLTSTEEEQDVLKEEWAHFAKLYISSCLYSKDYGSTLFGLIPTKKESVIEKLADEIDIVTRRFPLLLDSADTFKPFRKVVNNIFQEMTEY